MEELIENPLLSFSYPYDDYNHHTINAVRATNYKCAMTTYENIVTTKADLFTLPRVHVHNWDGEKFFKIIQNMFY